MRVFGPRTIVEAAFLVAVPIVALAAGLHRLPIIGASAAAYLLVVAIEATLARLSEAVEEPPRPQPAPRPAPKPVPPPAPLPEPTPEPEPEPEPEPQPELEPAAKLVKAAPREPDPPPPPPITPVERPAWTNVIPIGVSGAARRWSLWDLERLAREHAGGDPVVDEERVFLLLYLRDFADPDGLLPADFDALVRDSFGSLVTR